MPPSRVIANEGAMGWNVRYLMDNCVVCDLMESSRSVIIESNRITLLAQLISTVPRRVGLKIRWTGDGAGGIEGSEDVVR